MNIGKRKHAWPLAVGLSLAVVGMLAAFIVLAAQPGTASAQTDPCTGPFASLFPQCGGDGGNGGNGGDGGNDGGTTPPPMGSDGDMIDNSSTSASAAVELKLTIDSLPMSAVAGSSVELYLEDDFQVPDSIDQSTVYFTVDSSRAGVNGGGRVYATDPIEIDDDDHYGGDDDWSIQVFFPDFDTSDTVAGAGYDGPVRGESVTLVFTKAAGIKNPPEEGTHSVGYSVLGPNDGANDGPQVDLSTVSTLAKISLSDEDNSRGYELTVTGSGFNNGTSAAVHVLNTGGTDNESLWNVLNHEDCELRMTALLGSVEDPDSTYCQAYSKLDAAEKAVVDGLNFSSGAAEAALCSAIILHGSREGIATVGSDDKVAVSFEVSVPTFKAGDANYICMADGEGRTSNTDVEQFDLEPSIRVVPSAANAGDTINVFAQDFANGGAGFSELKIAGQVVYTQGADGNAVNVSSDSIGGDGSGTATFELPGSVSGAALEGTVRIDAEWGDTSEDAKITITGSQLILSKAEVAANESVTIRGTGFGDGAGCLTEATISGAPLMLISEDGVNTNGCIDVEVSSAGQFAATVAIWVDDSDDQEATNPALTPGTHTIKVKDDEGFTGTASIIIKEPTLTVTPDVAGPRDYITISGENWPVDNEDGGNIVDVEIDIDFGTGVDDEDADPDAAGSWSVTYRVDGDVVIPSTVQVKAAYGQSSEIVRVGSFSVPAADLMVEPMRATPGDTITLSATGFPLFESDIRVKIGSLSVNVPDSAHTDADGAIEGLEVLVPSLEQALYTVQLTVGDTVTIGELTVLDDVAMGAPMPLPDAVDTVGDNLEAVFYFNDATKSWQVYDPRPEWADLNTLTELVSGQAYWILVKDNQDNIVLNGRNRSLTCSGDNCWNLEVW